jgi:hypothetical protein
LVDFGFHTQPQSSACAFGATTIANTKAATRVAANLLSLCMYSFDLYQSSTRECSRSGSGESVLHGVGKAHSTREREFRRGLKVDMGDHDDACDCIAIASDPIG